MGELPTVHLPEAADRQRRALVAYRKWLVGQAKRVAQRLVAAVRAGPEGVSDGRGNQSNDGRNQIVTFLDIVCHRMARVIYLPPIELFRSGVRRRGVPRPQRNGEAQGEGGVQVVAIPEAAANTLCVAP